MVGEEFRSAFGNCVPGSQLASYRIVEQIGRGGMAVVYRARDIRLDRWVALKILAPDLALDQVFRQRFIRESRAAAAVDHPNIIPIFEAGEADGVLFIAMRFVGGQDVRSLIDREGTLPAARAAGIVAQVASALDAAHACGLVHRDVKPANMLLSDLAERGQADHVYLSDFGVSKQSDSTSSLTSTGQLVGTLDYLAPEQVEGRPVDGRADVYSLACAAFEMLAGVPPFKRDQSLAVLWAQLSAPPPLLTSRRSDLPPAIDQVMAKALAKSPGDRYDRCLDFASSLQRACGLRAADLAGGAPGRSAGPDTAPRSATVAGLPGVV
jgi:serine/threonine protein kinase